MATKILIVDDEQGYRDYLERSFTWEGYEVRTAESGREAIEIGSRFRPDVLVVDWMLKDQIHGIHVSRTLRVVCPYLQTILITGFPSPELKSEADHAKVYEFIQKPFYLDDIQASVREAVNSPRPKSPQVSMAVVEVDAEGDILYANERARELFAITRAGSDPLSLSDLFGPENVPDLDVAAEGWRVTTPLAKTRTNWHIRSQQPRKGGSRLVVFLRPDDPHHQNRQIIEMLLGVNEPKQIEWPFKGRVLVIEKGEIYRRFIVSTLEVSGASCYAVGGCAEALRVLETDPAIKFVILDCAPPETDISSVAVQIRAVRSNLILVGNSEDDCKDRFSAGGVEGFLLKPWRIVDLIDVLTDLGAEPVMMTETV